MYTLSVGNPTQHVNVVSSPMVRRVMFVKMKRKIRMALCFNSAALFGYDVGGVWRLKVSVNCVTVIVIVIIIHYVGNNRR